MSAIRLANSSRVPAMHFLRRQGVPVWPTIMEPPTWVAPKMPTPVKSVGSNLHAKLEGFHTGGSIKDRAVTHCVFGMLNNGTLRPGGTLAVCTSGSAGVALLLLQEKLHHRGVDFNVKIFLPKKYAPKVVPQAICRSEGINIIHSAPFGQTWETDMSSRSVNFLDGEFMDVLGEMKGVGEELGWGILDQHYDVNSVLAHAGTAQELMQQRPDLTDVVCTTGTGGTAMGLRTFLPAHVRVHARPAKAGSIDGITDVRRYGNFCDPDQLEGYAEGFFCPELAVESQLELEAVHKIRAGPSSGSTYALAKEIAARSPEAQVAFICADGITNELD